MRRRPSWSGRGLPGPIGQRLRNLASWAVASSLSAAMGCGVDEPQPEAPEAGRRAPVLAGAGGVGAESGAGASGALAVAGRSGAGAGGAAGEMKPLPPVEPVGWSPVPCDNLLLVRVPVMPALPVDYIALYDSVSSGAGMARATLWSDYGAACSGASDMPACTRAFEPRIQASDACKTNGDCGKFTVVTRGDTVERQDDAAALAGMLGEIDTASEAVLIAAFKGLRVSCPQSNPSRPMHGTEFQPTDNGYLVRSDYEECSAGTFEQQIEVRRDGSTSDLAQTTVRASTCAIGRRPAGLELVEMPAGCEPLGAFLAQVAQLEAASVPAFQRLHRELQQLGAADEDLAAARRSARDEVRHAQLMGSLAARYGGSPCLPRVIAPAAARSAFEVALENAVEGCVRETFGAVIAHHQAALARDAQVAEVMRGIALDETRHAELAWRVAAWLEPQLSEHERSLIAGAQHAGLRQLAREIEADTLPEVACQQIGWPSASVQQALLQRMASDLGLS